MNEKKLESYVTVGCGCVLPLVLAATIFFGVSSCRTRQRFKKENTMLAIWACATNAYIHVYPNATGTFDPNGPEEDYNVFRLERNHYEVKTYFLRRYEDPTQDYYDTFSIQVTKYRGEFIPRRTTFKSKTQQLYIERYSR